MTVPFGRRKALGFVVSKNDLKTKHEFALKDIEKKLENFPCFDQRQLKFFERVAQYYGDSLSNVIDAAVPPATLSKFEATIRLLDSSKDDGKSKSRSQVIAELIANGGKTPQSALTRKFKAITPALKKLAEVGAIEIEKNENVNYQLPSTDLGALASKIVTLNSEQSTADSAIAKSLEAREFKTFLLHGVTGSGKTEIYFDLIKRLANQNRGALLIVPEIALTPQLMDRFRARLGENIAVLHSGLNKRIRWNAWRALIEQKTLIAVGVRSAIFAPVQDLGIIIVDEEHDGSFKQSDGLRYNARDLAVLRGQFENCPVVLGSATPSLESYHKAKSKHYVYLPLNHRPSYATRPQIETVDMNQLKPWDMPSRNISPQLHAALKTTLENNQQAFILYNRRGFANYFQCNTCEQVRQCLNCSITLTYHQNKNLLLCHYCDYNESPSEFCRSCSEEVLAKGNGRMELRGAGTEKVFEEVQELFPFARVDRLDRDAADDFEKYQMILSKARKGETQVLVGTQMIAKGHDLPNVTLVGIVDCDVGLHMPDFRAGERTFHLLTQAAGRAGRGEMAGRVILQTRVPKHMSIRMTLEQNYAKFADYELNLRHGLDYPPFARLLRIVVHSMTPELPELLLSDFRKQILEQINRQQFKVKVVGPAPAPIVKVKNMWRWHLLLKSSSAKSLNAIMQSLRTIKVKEKNTRVIFDIDPQDML